MAESSARSSSRKSGSTGNGGGAGVVVSGSPIRYRVGPFFYEPPVKCKCRNSKKCPRWISWSVDNPGRRYYRCQIANTSEDCGFFEWLDPPCSPWMREVLLDMKAEVFKLKRESGQAVGDEEISEIQQMNQTLQRQLVNMDADLESQKEEVRKKDGELALKCLELVELQLKLKAAKNNWSTCSVFMIVFVMGIFCALFGKMM